jgi:hypothetical protein
MKTIKFQRYLVIPPKDEKEQKEFDRAVERLEDMIRKLAGENYSTFYYRPFSHYPKCLEQPQLLLFKGFCCLISWLIILAARIFTRMLKLSTILFKDIFVFCTILFCDNQP